MKTETPVSETKINTIEDILLQEGLKNYRDLLRKVGIARSASQPGTSFIYLTMS